MAAFEAARFNHSRTSPRAVALAGVASHSSLTKDAQPVMFSSVALVPPHEVSGTLRFSRKKFCIRSMQRAASTPDITSTR